MTQHERFTYVAHFEDDQGTVEHYMGSSTARSFTKRVYDHRCGHADCATDAFKPRGLKLTHLTIHQWQDEPLERAASRLPTLSLICERCHPENFAEPKRAEEGRRRRAKEKANRMAAKAEAAAL